MKAVIQKVLSCSVTVDNQLISSIGKGIFVLIGISRNDSDQDIEYMVRKILNIRLFEDNDKRWSKSVVDKGLEVLCVSQFTLCHNLRGNKLDFHGAMKAEDSKIFYDKFLTKLRMNYKPELIKDGQFGAYMQVDICNDGPVTIELDSLCKTEKDSGNKTVKDD